MAQRPYYKLEEAPEYADEVEQLLDTDPVKAQGSFFGDLILRILHNVKAVKGKADELTELVGDGLDLGEDDVLPEERGGTGKSDLSQVTAGNVSGYDDARVGGIVVGDGDPEEMGAYSLPIGTNVVAEGQYSIAVGQGAQAKGKYAVAVNHWNVAALAQGEASLAIGTGCTAEGKYSIASGEYNCTTGTGSWISGHYRRDDVKGDGSTGDYSVARGSSCCFGECSYATGISLTGEFDAEEAETGTHTFAMGESTAKAPYSCSFNNSEIHIDSNAKKYGTSLGESYSYQVYLSAGSRYDGLEVRDNGYYGNNKYNYSIVMGSEIRISTGLRTIAMGEWIGAGYVPDNILFGCHTMTQQYYPHHSYTVIAGLYNDYEAYGPDTSFVLGNGTPERRNNAFRIDSDGEVYVAAGVYLTGADYAEYFPWADENPESEDRTGLFVTLSRGRIRIAGPEDRMVLGVVSGAPCILGNCSHAHGNGALQGGWDAVGCLGQLVVRDNGHCRPDENCGWGEGGRAVPSPAGYRVLERIDEDKIRIWMR